MELVSCGKSDIFQTISRQSDFGSSHRWVYYNYSFVKMILKDSTFIIELFLRADKNDYILSNPLLNCRILEDLILVESQLPFFILEELHENFSKGHSENSFFIDLPCNYFYSCIKSIPNETEKEKERGRRRK